MYCIWSLIIINPPLFFFPSNMKLNHGYIHWGDNFLQRWGNYWTDTTLSTCTCNISYKYAAWITPSSQNIFVGALTKAKPIWVSSKWKYFVVLFPLSTKDLIINPLNIDTVRVNCWESQSCYLIFWTVHQSRQCRPSARIINSHSTISSTHSNITIGRTANSIKDIARAATNPMYTTTIFFHSQVPRCQLASFRNS